MTLSGHKLYKSIGQKEKKKHCQLLKDTKATLTKGNDRFLIELPDIIEMTNDFVLWNILVKHLKERRAELVERHES